MSSSNWPQQFGDSLGGQSSNRSVYTTSSSSQSFNSGGGGFSSFEGFPSFNSHSEQPSYTSTSHFESSTMGDSKAFYITSVTHGFVLAKQNNGNPSGVVVENKGDQDNEEKWTIEAGDEPNVIAIKCVANGEYLNANGNTNWSTVGTGEKQWWKVVNDDVGPPGACRLHPVPHPNVCLNHFNGEYKRPGSKVKVHMWQWVRTYPHCNWLTWYFMDTNASVSPAASGASDSGVSKADVDSKLKALEEREAALTKKDSDRSAEWDKKMKEVQDRQASSAQEEKRRASDYDQKLKDLQAREAELAKKQEQASKGNSGAGAKASKDDQAKKDAEIQRKLDDLKSTEQKVAADRAELDKAKSDLVAREKELQQRQKELEDEQSAAGQQNGAPKAPNGTATDSDLEKKQRDNSRLEQRLAKLEDQLANMNGANGSSASSSSNAGQPGQAGCGYKHYKPPRKINRKVVGLVYQ